MIYTIFIFVQLNIVKSVEICYILKDDVYFIIYKMKEERYVVNSRTWKSRKRLCKYKA